MSQNYSLNIKTTLPEDLNKLYKIDTLEDTQQFDNLDDAEFRLYNSLTYLLSKYFHNLGNNEVNTKLADIFDRTLENLLMATDINQRIIKLKSFLGDRGVTQINNNLFSSRIRDTQSTKVIQVTQQFIGNLPLMYNEDGTSYRIVMHFTVTLLDHAEQLGDITYIITEPVKVKPNTRGNYTIIYSFAETDLNTHFVARSFKYKESAENNFNRILIEFLSSQYHWSLPADILLDTINKSIGDMDTPLKADYTNAINELFDRVSKTIDVKETDDYREFVIPKEYTKDDNITLRQYYAVMEKTLDSVQLRYSHDDGKESAITYALVEDMVD